MSCCLWFYLFLAIVQETVDWGRGLWGNGPVEVGAFPPDDRVDTINRRFYHLGDEYIYYWYIFVSMVVLVLSVLSVLWLYSQRHSCEDRELTLRWLFIVEMMGLRGRGYNRGIGALTVAWRDLWHAVKERGVMARLERKGKKGRIPLMKGTLLTTLVGVSDRCAFCGIVNNHVLPLTTLSANVITESGGRG